MLKTALVAMTVIGCDCDARLCEFVRETPAQWASVAECEAALKIQVIRDSDLQYPVITGICRPAAGGTPAFPTLVAGSDRMPAASQPAAADAAQAAVEPEIASPLPRQVLGGGKAALFRTAGGYTLVKATLGGAAGAATGAMRRSVAWISARMPSAF